MFSWITGAADEPATTAQANTTTNGQVMIPGNDLCSHLADHGISIEPTSTSLLLRERAGPGIFALQICTVWDTKASKIGRHVIRAFDMTYRERTSHSSEALIAWLDRLGVEARFVDRGQGVVFIGKDIRTRDSENAVFSTRTCWSIKPNLFEDAALGLKLWVLKFTTNTTTDAVRMSHNEPETKESTESESESEDLNTVSDDEAIEIMA